MSYSLDPLTAPAYSVKEGNGWLAVFNPDARRQMDVQFRSGYTHNGCVLVLRGSFGAHRNVVRPDQPGLFAA